MSSDLDDILGEVGRTCRVTQARMRARSLTRSYDAALRPIGLRSTEYAILIAVGSLGDGRLSDLAQGLDMDPSTLTRALQALENKGLVTVEVQGHRTRRAHLTDEGASKVREGYPLWQSAQENAANNA